jgi:hypothetical protein
LEWQKELMGARDVAEKCLIGREIGYKQIIHPFCYTQLTDTQRDELMHKNKNNIILPEPGDKSINMLLNYDTLKSPIHCIRCDAKLSKGHQGFSFDKQSTKYVHFACAIEIMKFRKHQIEQILAVLSKNSMSLTEIPITGDFRFIKETSAFFKKSLLYYGYDANTKIVDKREIFIVTCM